MPLPTYTAEQRREFAAKLPIEEQYLYQILRGIKVPSAGLARRMNQIDPACRLQDLRPDDWHEIWPELIPASVESGEVVTEVAGQGA